MPSRPRFSIAKDVSESNITTILIFKKIITSQKVPGPNRRQQLRSTLFQGQKIRHFSHEISWRRRIRIFLKMIYSLKLIKNVATPSIL
jgi:hypothetical protein